MALLAFASSTLVLSACAWVHPVRIDDGPVTHKKPLFPTRFVATFELSQLIRTACNGDDFTIRAITVLAHLDGAWKVDYVVMDGLAVVLDDDINGALDEAITRFRVSRENDILYLRAQSQCDRRLKGRDRTEPSVDPHPIAETTSTRTFQCIGFHRAATNGRSMFRTTIVVERTPDDD